MTLEEVYSQARKLTTDGCAEHRYEGFCIFKGVKISLDKTINQVFIYNTTIGGDYYQEVSPYWYEVFKEKGWLFGCYSLSLTNYKRKLDTIENLIQECFAKKTSDKQYRKLKTSRTNYLLKYNDARNKLNKLTNKIKQNGNS